MKKIPLSVITSMLVIGLILGHPSAVMAQEPAQEAAQEPVQEAVQEPAQEPVQEPAQEAVQEPAQEAVQEPAQEAAQEAAQGGSTDFMFEEVVTTSQRREENVQDVPVSITALTGDALEALNIDRTDQLGSQVPNLNIQSWSGDNVFVAVNIRGVYSLGHSPAHGQSAVVYSDDLVLDNYLAHGLSFFDMERAEVLRGPQGTLFGRNSTAGALQIISKRPGDELNGYAKLTYGNYNRLRVEGAVGGAISDKGGMRLAVFSDQKDGWLENTYTGEKIGDAKQFAIRNILEFDLTDDIDLFLKFQHSNVEQEPDISHSTLPNPHIFVESDPSLAPLLYNPGPSSDYTKVNINYTTDELKEDLLTYQYVMTLNWDLGGVLLTSVTGYQDIVWESVTDWDATAVNSYHSSIESDYDALSQELRFTSESESAFQWIVGGFFLRANSLLTWPQDFTGFYELGYGIPAPEGYGWGDLTIDDHTATSIAAFAHTSVTWTDRFATTQALRYTRDTMEQVKTRYEWSTFPLTSNLSFTDVLDHTDAGGGSTVAVSGQQQENSTDQLTWRLAGEYGAKDDLLLYVSLSTGYKAGKIAAYGYDEETGEFPFIEPETNLAPEVGIKSTWLNNRLIVNGAVFYYDYENLHALTTLQTGVGQYVDTAIPKAYFAGGEVEIVAQPVENSLISLGLGYVQTEIEEYVNNASEDLTGNKVAYAPEVDFNAVVLYGIPLTGGVLTPQFDCNYTGAYYPTNENLFQLGEYWTYNARLTYGRGPWSVNLYVENIADERHVMRINKDPVSLSVGTDIMSDGPPRTYGVSVRGDF